MKKRQFAVAGTLAILVGLDQVPGRTQGLNPTQGQAAQMVERTVAGVKFSTPPGFAVERINPADKKDSYVVITFDSQGRLVVSKENDNPRYLLDANGDGIYETEKVISDQVRNCQGLWFDGPVMYGACMPPLPPPAPGAAPAPAQGQGRGNAGPQQMASIFKLTDANGDDVTEKVEIFGRINGRIEEHGIHALRRGPDGQLTLMSGNFAVVANEDLDESSPVLKDKNVQFLPHIQNWNESTREGIHSGVYRWDPAQKKFVILFGGNRNAYDYAYNLSSEAFAFDSDMEWDIGMPWYRDVRTVHGIPNGNYGYRANSGKYPEYYLDSLPPVRDIGRGSPVGVETYQSYAYPRDYFDNLLEADWSRGRLLYTALTPKGATFTARTDRAEFVHGEPLNITDVEVGPDGLVYFTTGGRNTEGGVWRVRYTGAAPARPDMTGLLAVTRQAQPLSSFGWAAIEKVKATMGATFGPELEKLARNTAGSADDRARALYEMQRHGPAPSASLLGALVTDRAPAVRAAVMFVTGVQGEAAAKIAGAGLKDADPVVRRRAAEALVRMGQSPTKPSLAPVADIYALLNDTDRFVRWAGRIAIEQTARAEWKDRVMAETNPFGAIEGMLALVRTAPAGESLTPITTKQFAMLKQTNLTPENKLRLFRAFQYTAAETPTGLSAPQREQLHGLIANQFPSTDERMNRELALMLAYAGQPQAIEKILAAFPAGNENQPLQLHYLYALRTLKQGWTPTQKAQLAEIMGRAAKWRGGAQFANFLNAYFDQISAIFVTDAEKQLLYSKAPDFAPLSPEEVAAMAARAGGPGRGGAGAAGAPPAAAAAPTAGAAAAPAPAGAAAAAPAAGARAGGGGGRGNTSAIGARTAGRVLSKGEIFDEVIYTPRAAAPNVEAGKTLFEANCASCHKVGVVGNDHGVPALNLTAMAPKTARRDLLESVMFPSRKVAAGSEASLITRNDGTTVTGLIVKDDASGLTVLLADGKTTVVAKPVRSNVKQKTSIMVDALTDAMSQANLTNLLAFMQGPTPSAAAPATTSRR